MKCFWRFFSYNDVSALVNLIFADCSGNTYVLEDLVNLGVLMLEVCGKKLQFKVNISSISQFEGFEGVLSAAHPRLSSRLFWRC